MICSKGTSIFTSFQWQTSTQSNTETAWRTCQEATFMIPGEILIRFTMLNFSTLRILWMKSTKILQFLMSSTSPQNTKKSIHLLLEPKIKMKIARIAKYSLLCFPRGTGWSALKNAFSMKRTVVIQWLASSQKCFPKCWHMKWEYQDLSSKNNLKTLKKSVLERGSWSNADLRVISALEDNSWRTILSMSKFMTKTVFSRTNGSETFIRLRSSSQKWLLISSPN